MLETVNTIFCENIYQMADGRHFAAGIYAGRVNLPPDVEVPSFFVDILLQFESRVPGTIQTDIRFLDVKGEMFAQNSFPFEFKEANDMVTLAFNKAVIPNKGSGIVRIEYRTPDVNWTECGLLRIIAPAKVHSAPLGH